MASDERETGPAPGRWLREQRERRGISSQAELARMLGWDKSTVNNYETRGVTVPDDRAEEIAQFFRLGIIEVRRNLGLWVPPPEGDEEPGPGSKQEHADNRTADEVIDDVAALRVEIAELRNELRRDREDRQQRKSS